MNPYRSMPLFREAAYERTSNFSDRTKLSYLTTHGRWQLVVTTLDAPALWSSPGQCCLIASPAASEALIHQPRR
jgi:hypothetical protein